MPVMTDIFQLLDTVFVAGIFPVIPGRLIVLYPLAGRVGGIGLIVRPREALKPSDFRNPMTAATFDLYCSIGTTSLIFGDSIIKNFGIIIHIFC